MIEETKTVRWICDHPGCTITWTKPPRNDDALAEITAAIFPSKGWVTVMRHGEKRAEFCSAAHAIEALLRG